MEIYHEILSFCIKIPALPQLALFKALAARPLGALAYTPIGLATILKIPAAAFPAAFSEVKSVLEFHYGQVSRPQKESLAGRASRRRMATLAAAAGSGRDASRPGII
jgi:hypothetical protein